VDITLNTTVKIMKILFLDIDGVLNTPFGHDPEIAEKLSNKPLKGSVITELWSADDLFPKLVEKLNKIIEQTGALVVISSSWRRVYPPSNIAKMLEKQGFKGKVIGKTPVIFSSYGGPWKDRGDEIKEWLDANDGVDSFVILDDIDFEGIEKHFPKQFIRTDCDVGLTDDNVQKAVQILMNKE
jgi:hypothetical protein